jgi:hypothetical protein
MLNYGDVVKSKEYDDVYGIVNFSIWGYSVSYWDSKNKGMIKTFGCPEHQILKYWEPSHLPEGYEIHKKYKVIVKRGETIG